MKSRENLFGAWAILIGLIIAVTLGIFQASVLIGRRDWIYGLLAVLGILVGLMSLGNDSKEASTFLFATISLVIVSYMGQTALTLVGNIGVNIVVVLNALLTMFIPATIIVSLKVAFSIASYK